MKHSRTSSSSYERDFCELIEAYTSDRNRSKNNISKQTEKNWLECTTDDRDSFESDDDITFPSESCVKGSKRKELSVEYLEDECDLSLDVDDLDGNFLKLYA